MDEFEGLVENSLLDAEMMEKQLEEPRLEFWEKIVPLTTAFLAAFATVAALLAAFAADKELERRIERIVDDVGRNHAVTQREIIRSREEHLVEQGKSLSVQDQQKLQELDGKIRTEQAQEQELNLSTAMLSKAHHILALGITMFQISIAISATSLLARKRYLWALGMFMMVMGLFVSGYGIYFYSGIH